MATKTFEELKQLAIQIRDEKTNKQNTATRIGTQMLEHLDKIEQDYYDKTATDEELKERDEKLIELEQKINELNISTLYPTSGIDNSNRYDLTSAIALIPEQYRVSGLCVTFMNENFYIENWIYKGGGWNIDNFFAVGENRFSELVKNYQYFSTYMLELYRENVVNSQNRNITSKYYTSSNLTSTDYKVIGVRVVDRCSMRIATITDIHNMSNSLLAEKVYKLQNGVNIFDEPIVLGVNQYLAFTDIVSLIAQDATDLYNITDNTIDKGYALCASIITDEVNKELQELSTVAHLIENDISTIKQDFYFLKSIDEKLDLSSLNDKIDTSGIYYSGIYCEKCDGVKYKAKEGKVRFYKIKTTELGGGATYELLAEFTNSAVEERCIKEVFLNADFASNEYLGISGSIYFGSAEGYTMYQIGSDKTDNFALAYMPVKEVSAIDDLYNKINNEKNGGLFEVGVDKKYKTISEAVLEAVKVGTKNKPAVIMIYPGVYNEYCNINGKEYLSIIGVDKKRVIWRYDDANYQHAPLRIAGNCYVKNITFIATAKNYISDIDQAKGFDAWKRDNLAGHYPPGYPTWLGKLGSYAVHCDDEHNDDGELVVSTFEDCIMYSETMPAFGGGLWPSYKIELIRCDLRGKYDKEFYDHVNLEGALYVHGIQTGQISGVYKEHLYMNNCTVSSNYKRVATFQNVESKTEDLDYLFYYNIFDSDELTDAELITFDGVTVNQKSYGNNTKLLNGIVE